jgi:hypothetical protein
LLFFLNQLTFKSADLFCGKGLDVEHLLFELLELLALVLWLGLDWLREG